MKYQLFEMYNFTFLPLEKMFTLKLLKIPVAFVFVVSASIGNIARRYAQCFLLRMSQRESTFYGPSGDIEANLYFSIHWFLKVASFLNSMYF